MDERHLDWYHVIEERRRLHTDHDEQLEDDILVAALAALLLEHPFER